jgi:mono/diheme cytochrome c family protein
LKQNFSSILRVVALGIGVLALPAFAAAQSSFTPKDEALEDFPDAPGREDAFYACSACHGFKLVAAQGMSRARWDDTIDFMIRQHKMPPLADKDRAVVLDYLVRAFPERQPSRGFQNPFLKP